MAVRRSECLAAWVAELDARRPALLRRPRWLRTAESPEARTRSAGALAVRSIRKHTEETHRRVLALIDELVALGRDAPASAEGASHEHVPEAAEAEAVTV